MNNADVFVEALFELVFEHAHNDRVLKEVRQRGLLTDEEREPFKLKHVDDVALLAECIRRGIRPPQSDREIIDELVKRGIKPLVVTWGDVSEYLNHADHKELRDTLQLIVTRL